MGSAGGQDRARARAEERRLRVLATVDSIPRGRVATYGGIAEEAGLGRAARLVGRLLRELEVGVPWHRVINASGRLSVSGETAELQRSLLEDEGVEFSPSGRIDLERFGWPRGE